MLEIKIDGQPVGCKKGDNLLSLIRSCGIDIPTLCALPGSDERAVCRLCVVEMRQRSRLVPACATSVEVEMEVITSSPEILKVRQSLMKMILLEHGQCKRPDCPIEELAESLSVRVGERRHHISIPDERDLSSEYLSVQPNLCVHCDRCIRSCDLNIIARAGRGSMVSMIFDDNSSLGFSSCTSCGDCAAACPSGAIRRK